MARATRCSHGPQLNTGPPPSLVVSKLPGSNHDSISINHVPRLILSTRPPTSTAREDDQSRFGQGSKRSSRSDRPCQTCLKGRPRSAHAVHARPLTLPPPAVAPSGSALSGVSAHTPTGVFSSCLRSPSLKRSVRPRTWRKWSSESSGRTSVESTAFIFGVTRPKDKPVSLGWIWGLVGDKNRKIARPGTRTLNAVLPKGEE